MNDAIKTPETAYDRIDSASKTIGLDFTKDDLAVLAEKYKYSDKDIQLIENLFNYLVQRKKEAAAESCLQLSRLPRVNPKTFDNFDFTRIHGTDTESLKALANLSPLYKHETVAFIGSSGLGKTHLAMAFGYKCCQLGFKTYFITASELNGKFSRARKNGNTESTINGLVRPSCLIVDEVGHCTFDRDNTRMFFDVINRRTNKKGPHCLILTSNMSPDTWGSYFEENDTILCTMDRIFDDALVYMMKGTSYRGQKLQTLAVEVQ